MLPSRFRPLNLAKKCSASPETVLLASRGTQQIDFPGLGIVKHCLASNYDTLANGIPILS